MRHRRGSSATARLALALAAASIIFNLAVAGATVAQHRADKEPIRQAARAACALRVYEDTSAVFESNDRARFACLRRLLGEGWAR